MGSLGIDFKRLVDQLLGNAVVGDVEKACGAAEQTGSICQCLFVLLLAFQGPAYKNFKYPETLFPHQGTGVADERPLAESGRCDG